MTDASTPNVGAASGCCSTDSFDDVTEKMTVANASVPPRRIKVPSFVTAECNSGYTAITVLSAGVILALGTSDHAVSKYVVHGPVELPWIESVDDVFGARMIAATL